MKVALYGFGAMNTAIAAHLDRKLCRDAEITFWEKEEEVLRHFRKHHSHPYHFQQIIFGSRVNGIEEAAALVSNAEHIIIGISSQAIRENVRKFCGYINCPSTITIVSKGLEKGTKKRLSQVVEEELRASRYRHGIAVFSGGTTSQDIADGVPLTAEVASVDMAAMEKAAELLHSRTLRIYTNDDIVSVELAGALKNVVSLGAGICIGLGYRAGTVASFVTRASRDIYKIAKGMGADDSTFLPGSSSFWGDIMLSCFGETRNREFGIRIGKGAEPGRLLGEMEQEHKTIEGYWTVEAAYEIAREHNVDAPCIGQLYEVVHKGKSAKEALAYLMSRQRSAIR